MLTIYVAKYSKMPYITAVIPAFNEEMRIVQTLKEISPLVDEVIVVDDASTDKTALLARQGGATVYTHPENKGYIASVKYGFREAHGDIVVTLDADGEFSAKFVPALLKPILDGQADMVQGHRSYVPRPSERFLTWLASSKATVGDSGTGLRAMKADLAKSLEIRGACICGVLSLEVASKGGVIAEIPIELKTISKPRKIAWFHLKQLYYLFPWLIKRV